MLIKLTQEHIDRGTRGDCLDCPLALAAKEAGIKTPWVTETYITSDNASAPDDKMYLPKIATDFIRNFDGEVEGADASKCVPFEFELDL